MVSIPQSGFCVLKLRAHAKTHGTIVVSIPQSGFCVLKRIQVVYGSRTPVEFQSLSRDSVCSNLSRAGYDAPADAVSIPQSGFCVLKPPSGVPRYLRTGQFQSLSRDSVCSNNQRARTRSRPDEVSIPQSGFCVLKRSSSGSWTAIRSCFKPSVGILCAQTR